MPDYTFPASAKLKSRKQIQKLFTEGKSIKRFPLRLLYRIDTSASGEPGLQLAIGVSSRRIGLAVRRNKVKRWIREAYRLESPSLRDQLIASGKKVHIAIINLGDDSVNYQQISKAIHFLMEKLEEELLSGTSGGH